MNPIEHLLHLINILMACSALAMSEQTIGGQSWQVQQWACQTQNGPITVTSYRRQCDTGRAKYWGRPHYARIEEWQIAWYLNRYGEVYVGEGALLENAYQTTCGS